MTNATLPAVPTAHTSATLDAVYVDVTGDMFRVSTAHTTAGVSTNEPGP